ncbi:biotin-dependent carboxyltransferase family protein [soil metagenome]
MSILIKRPGILSTVQDCGRFGHQCMGINPNGVMDSAAMRSINCLLNNDEDEAVVEMHFPAADILFEKDAVFAIGGGDFDAKLNGTSINNWQVDFAAEGSNLAFRRPLSGSRTYFSVQGGFGIEPWLGSRSTNAAASIGGFEGRPLTAGDRIHMRGSKFSEASIGLRISREMVPQYSSSTAVRFIPGGEFGMLSDDSRQRLRSSKFTVSKSSDRMGFRLIGEPLHLEKPVELLSSAVSFGTMQLLPDNELIVLMADHQTTGGYPRIGNVVSTDLPLLAQLSAGDDVSFEQIAIDEAEDLILDFENNINWLKIGVRLRTAT